MVKYKVTNLLGSFDGECPPRVINFIFPGFSGELVVLKSDEFTVDFASEAVISQIQGVSVSKWNEQLKSWDKVAAPTPA